MLNQQNQILKALETELRFLEDGGYRNDEMWRPQFAFLDSPTCIHPASSGRPEACKECPLIGFVPKARLDAPIPCHHIPLTKEGFTVDSLSRWGTREELESALRNWLREKIEALNGGEEPPSNSSNNEEEADAFCSRIAG